LVRPTTSIAAAPSASTAMASGPGRGSADLGGAVGFRCSEEVVIGESSLVGVVSGHQSTPEWDGDETPQQGNFRVVTMSTRST
jgi:hypothetical protein